MDKLEFENFSIEDETKERQPSEIQEGLINTSVNIIKALEQKVKSYSGPGKVTLAQLKKVFYDAARSTEEENKLEWAMARVNMFLRMKSNHIVVPSPDKQRTAKITRIDKFIDITASWSPSTEDFEEAKKDIQEFEINNFNSVSDLYLQDYTKLDVTIDWN
jgi:hypothetical protein